MVQRGVQPGRLADHHRLGPNEDVGCADGRGIEGRADPADTKARPDQPGRPVVRSLCRQPRRTDPVAAGPEELTYRRLQTQPNFGHYRECYDAARDAKDDFAARFYFSLFPPPERTRIRAEEIVRPLFARLLLRDDVLDALKAQPAADPEIQAACLKLAATWPESAEECNDAAWALVRDPGQPDASYRARPAPGQGRLPARADNGTFLNTLGSGPVPLRAHGRGAGDPDTVNRPEQRRKNLPTWPSWPWPSTDWVIRKVPHDPGPAARSDEEFAVGPKSASSGLAPRSRDDRARPGLPGRPVRA